MKILLATYWTVPHLGGVWNYMQQLKKSLEQRGHEVDLLGYGEDNQIVHIVNKRRIEKSKLLPFLQAKMPPHMFPDLYRNKLVEYSEFQRYIFELGAVYLGIDQYDLIHTQDVISTTCINRIRSPKTPLIATIHGSVAHEIRRQLTTLHKSPTSYMAREYYDNLETIGATSSDLSIVANHWLETILMDEFNVPKNKLRVLHYGFDTEEFIKQKNKQSYFQRPNNKKVIVYTGRLVELKGVQFLIEALSKLKAIRDDWVCWIVGDGEMKDELQTQSTRLNLQDDIFFLGQRNDIPSILSKSDIYVLPTLIENQPLSLIEAQLAGKASIVSNVGGLPEMVEHNVTGLLVEPEDSYGLFVNLNKLLTDSLLTRNLGENAKKWGMTHWSFENGIRNLLAIYEEVIASKKGSEDK